MQEISFGPKVRVRAHLRLSERNTRLNRKLLRATLSQPNLTELTIADMLPHDLDADLVRHSVTAADTSSGRDRMQRIFHEAQICSNVSSSGCCAFVTYAARKENRRVESGCSTFT